MLLRAEFLKLWDTLLIAQTYGNTVYWKIGEIKAMIVGIGSPDMQKSVKTFEYTSDSEH